MKKFAFCAFALLVMTAPTAVEKSHDIYVNGHFLISSYNVGGKQAVAFDDVARVLGSGGRLTINGGRVNGEPTSDLRTAKGFFIKRAAVLGNVWSSNGRLWIATADFLKQLGGVASVPLSQLRPGAALQIRLFDCPDVRCCPDCGIAFR